MNFYRRYRADDRCVIICLRCFETVGTVAVSAAADAERRHVCGLEITSSDSNSAPPSSIAVWSACLAAFACSLRRRYVAVLFLALAVLLYAVPTAIEAAALGHVGPWLAVIGFGDVVGCMCLALLQTPFSAFILYIALTCCETILYTTGAVSAPRLVWMVDLVPTIVVALTIVRLRSTARRNVAGPATP